MMEPAERRYEIRLAWAGAYKWTLCLCIGRVVGVSESDPRVWAMAIDEIRSCRVASKELDTPQLDLASLPTEVQEEANRLVGTIQNLVGERVELGLTQYIVPP